MDFPTKPEVLKMFIDDIVVLINYIRSCIF